MDAEESPSKSLKWFSKLVSQMDRDNTETSLDNHHFTFTCADSVASEHTIKASKDIISVPLNEADQILEVKPSLDYLFVSCRAEQPFTFLKPPVPDISPIILTFSWSDRNTYLSTKMVYDFFPQCRQLFLCRVDNFKSKGLFTILSIVYSNCNTIRNLVAL